jgi:hypothetical protein
VVVPKKAAPGYPWSWQGCYWNHQPQTEVELLKRGFHIAFVAPDAGRQGKAWDTWYNFLTEKHGLAKRSAFIGMSKGGANEATSITRIVSRRERVFGTPHHRCTFGRFWTSPTGRRPIPTC